MTNMTTEYRNIVKKMSLSGRKKQISK